MGLDANLMDIIKFGLMAPLKDRTALKYMAFLFVFVLVAGLVANYFVYSSFKPIVDNPALVSNPAAAMGIIVQFISFFGAIMLLYMVVISAMQYLLIARALAMLRQGSQPATPMNVLRLIVLGIAHMLCALFSVFNLRMLLIAVVGAVLFVAGALMLTMIVTAPAIALLGAVLLLVGVVAAFAYAVVIIHNMIRLIVSEIALVGKGLSIAESLRFSWDRTKGNVLNIFVIGLVLSVILGIINLALSVPGGVYSFLAQLAGATSFGLLADPAYMALLIPGYLGSAFMIAASIFYVTAVYSYLLAEKKVPSAAATPAPAAAAVPARPRARPKAKKKAKKK